MGTPDDAEVVVVTGAASGIGRAVAEAFLDRGARVVAADVDGDRLDDLATGARERGRHVLGHRVDLRDPVAAAGVVDTAVDRYGRLDVLVDNAGVMDRFVPLHDLDDELWRLVVAVDLDAPMATMRAALPVMLRQGSGTILDVASLAGLRGGAAGAAYTASKHALVGLTRHVGWQYGPAGVRCVALCPGAVATGLSLDGAHPDGLARVEPVLAASPGVASAADIAALALLLASPAAGVVNGTTVVGDLGWSAG